MWLGFDEDDSTNLFSSLNGPWQGKVVVVDSAQLGVPSILESTVTGIYKAAGFRVSKCSSRCVTCPKSTTDKYFTSNIIHQEFNIINHSGKDTSCHSQNLIFLLSCKNCNFQRVSQTTIVLHKQMTSIEKLKLDVNIL